MPPQSHEEMIREFAKLAGGLNAGNTRKSKAKFIARKLGAELLKLTAGFTCVLFLSVVGWVFLDALHEVGLISWSVTFWQGIRLIAPVLLLLIATPLTLNIRLKQ